MRRARTTLRNRERSAPRVKRALLKIDGRTVEIILRANPRARRYIVQVDPTTGEVSVVAPSARSLSQALEFARKEREWIAGRLANIPLPVELTLGAPILFRGVVHIVRRGESAQSQRGPVWVDRDALRPAIRVTGHSEHSARRVLDWMKREARRRIAERVAEYSVALGVWPQRVTIRDTSSRWGSCSSSRILSFSWRLIMAPAHVLDYVVAHEVAHLREMNHEPRFWRLVDSLVPQIGKPQAWLSENGAVLHRYAPRQRYL